MPQHIGRSTFKVSSGVQRASKEENGLVEDEKTKATHYGHVESFEKYGFSNFEKTARKSQTLQNNKESLSLMYLNKL